MSGNQDPYFDLANFGEALVSVTLSAVAAANDAEVRRSQIDNWAVARVGALLSAHWRDPEAPPLEAIENHFLPHPVPIAKSARIISTRTAEIYQRLVKAGTISDFAIGVLAPIARELRAVDVS